MIELNTLNGADRILRFVQSLIIADFPDDYLIGVEMGVAYGGGIEALGKLWKGHGMVYGFDTFAGHPKELSLDAKSMEAVCMDEHYANFGHHKLTYKYQRSELDRQGLSNVILVKGLITGASCASLPFLHYCLLDLDLLISMEFGYAAVRDKIVDGGYLCLHDVLSGVLPGLVPWYAEIKKDWEVIFEGEKEDLAVLRRKSK